MSLTSGFYNSLDGDRKYTAEQLSDIFTGVIKDGIFASVGDSFSVTADGQTQKVLIGTGRAWFNSKWIKNDSRYNISLPNAEVIKARIDAVVMVINTENEVRAADIVIMQGTPFNVGETEILPEVVSSLTIFRYPIAYVYRAPASVAVSNNDIRDNKGTETCPYVTAMLEINSAFTQFDQEFRTWFEDIQKTMSEDIATELLQRVIELERRATTLESRMDAEEAATADMQSRSIRHDENGYYISF